MTHPAEAPKAQAAARGAKPLVMWPWAWALINSVFAVGLWVGFALVLFVAGGVLTIWTAALLDAAAIGLSLVPKLSQRFIIDDEGVEMVRLRRRDRAPWSRIARLQASMEYTRQLEIVLAGPPEQILKPSWGIATSSAERRLLVETMNAYARRHGIPSTVTVDKLSGADLEE